LIFLKRAISHAIFRDGKNLILLIYLIGSCGGIIRTMVVTKDGSESSYTPYNELPFN